MSNNTEIYFGSRNRIIPFRDALMNTQVYLSEHYADLLMEKPDDENKKHLFRYIRQFLIENFIACEGYSLDTLVEALYSEMMEYSILTEYLNRDDVEEINVNGWDDIEVIFNNGTHIKLDRTFDSPQHALNVLRRMLHISGNIIDDAMPAVLGHLGKNIRIAALKAPIVDGDRGISCSVRIVNPRNLTKEDFVNSGTATGMMLDFLSLCLQYSASICISGETSGGKTTLAGYLLSTYPDDLRLFAIENGSRELNLIKYDENGRIKNRVVNALTRPSEDPSKNIDQNKLLSYSLRFDPDLIVVGEMRDEEAYTAQEAARTGHSVLTTVHANSAEATYDRMVTLCKLSSNLDKADLMEYVVDAFPIVVFAKKLRNKSRKIMDILECEKKQDGTYEYHHLFRYVVKRNRKIDGKFIIEGEFRNASQISKRLFNMLRDNGMSDEEYISIFGKLPDYAVYEEGGE